MENTVRLLWLGVFAAWTVYGIYIYNFGPGQWFKLSSSPGDWGVFGDYVGGLLNPFFSFLAFGGVIITVFLQARQLDIVRDQANFEEIQRVLSMLSTRIDGLLAARPMEFTARHRKVAYPPKSVFELIAGLGTRYVNKPEKGTTDWDTWAMSEADWQEVRQTVENELSTLSLELETLAWTLNRYASEGGNKTVMDYYKYRYQAVLVWLDAMGILNEHGQVHRFFHPKESYQYMKSESEHAKKHSPK